jgi:maleylpyruvate isomerase
MSAPAPAKPTFVLYSYWRSSSSWRVRIALAWKQIAYEYAPVHLVEGGGQQWTPEYLSKNPQGMVPLLEWEEAGQTRLLSQSVAIIEYLEERFPEPPLLPRDPYLRGRARLLAEIVNSGIQPFQNLSVMQRIAREYQGDDKAWARDFIGRGLAAFDRQARVTAGRYCVGDAVSMADVHLVPQLYAARRFGADLAPFPRLTDIEARLAELPAFQAAHADAQPDAPKTA